MISGFSRPCSRCRGRGKKGERQANEIKYKSPNDNSQQHGRHLPRSEENQKKKKIHKCLPWKVKKLRLGHAGLGRVTERAVGNGVSEKQSNSAAGTEIPKGSKKENSVFPPTSPAADLSEAELV